MVLDKLLNRDNDKNIYKMFKIPDVGEKPRWVIVGGDGIIINKSPTKEELKSAKKWTFKHNSTETCYRCGGSFDEVWHPYKEKDKEGKWLGIWNCHNCWQKYDPNSDNNKRILNSDCRNNDLDPNSEVGIGYITAVLVKKFLGIEDCFDITNNFNYPKYDMIEHEDWGLIDAKGSSLLTTKDGYLYHLFNTRKNKKADFFFCIGYDEDRKHVIEVFIIPNEEYVSKLDAIKIYYNQNSKYNKFKENEEEVKKWDDLFHTMKLDNCPVLRKSKSHENSCGMLE